MAVPARRRLERAEKEGILICRKSICILYKECVQKGVWMVCSRSETNKRVYAEEERRNEGK